MKCCLVSAATVNEFQSLDELSGEDKERIPLGVLSLAGALEREATPANIVDLDRLYLDWLGWDAADREARDFSAYVAVRLASMDVRVFGFSSICSSYPLTLRIAEALKRLRPDVHIILGGPQATATAEETLDAFTSVDTVVRGEAEIVLPMLLRSLEVRGDLCSVPGLVFRGSSGIVRTPDGPLLTDLDSLPAPAFYLLPYLKEYSTLPVEIGRGCPFSCTFCSTNHFFRHAFRTKSIERVVEQILSVRREYDVTSFDLVHDNFTVNRDRVVEFCEALVAARAKITWSCSARTDCMDDGLLDLMARAGCKGIFFGVESGSARMQHIIRKGLDLGEARERIRHANRRKVTTAVSLITGFREETIEDLKDTVRFFVDALLFDHVEPQLTLLSPLPGTPIHLRSKHQLILDDVISDMAFQGSALDAQDRDLIAAHSSIFSSYYSVPTLFLDRHFIYELRHFLLNLRSDFRWLLVALDQITGDLVQLFAAWQGWSATFSRAKRNEKLRAYYGGAVFRQEFLTFVRKRVTEQYPDVAHVLLALVEYLERPGPDTCGTDPFPKTTEQPGVLSGLHGLAVRAEGLHVTRLEVDFSRIVRCLRRRGRLSRVPRQKTTLVTRIRKERTEIIQLSPESAELLELCDGSRDVEAVMKTFARPRRSVNGVPRKKACLIGLELLRKQGLVRILPPGVHSGETRLRTPKPSFNCSDSDRPRRAE
jgi:radical SAM superfamily enzyme YgiQ (UPF0313 family)